MRRLLLAVAVLFTCTTLHAEEEAEAILFTPPKGWRFAEASSLPPNVKVMVVGTPRREFPPSINLGMEKFEGTLKDYLQIVRRINEEQQSDWKDLGTLRTDAGNASLSQLDTRTEWGNVRMMHAILVKDGYAYILTAAALRDEFSLYYTEFFSTMRSLRFDRVSTEQLAELK